MQITGFYVSLLLCPLLQERSKSASDGDGRDVPSLKEIPPVFDSRQDKAWETNCHWAPEVNERNSRRSSHTGLSCARMTEMPPKRSKPCGRPLFWLLTAPGRPFSCGLQRKCRAKTQEATIPCGLGWRLHAKPTKMCAIIGNPENKARPRRPYRPTGGV